jgi:polysaccharide pyruvyl transferase WcaK-like protein
VTTPAVESTDAAVFLHSRPDDAFADVERRILAQSGRPRVVVAVRDFQPAYGLSAELRSRVLGELARTLDHVQRELGDVFFLSTDHNPQSLKKTDVEIAHAVQGMMRTPGSTVIDVDIGVPSALKHIYGHFDAMVSMRLHPTILALGRGVPCLLLSYDSKCDDFFARLRLNDFMLPLATFNAPAAIERVSRMLRDRAIRDHITPQYDALRRAHADDWDPMFEQIAGRAREIAGRAGAGIVRRPGGYTRVRRAG